MRAPQRGLAFAREGFQPEIAATCQLLGASCYRAGIWQDAIDALNKGTELTEGGDAIDWLLLAMAHWQLGNQSEAIQWYERAADAIEQKRPLSLQNFSHPFHLRDLRDEAATLMETAAGESPPAT